jgi:hypothetical protein
MVRIVVRIHNYNMSESRVKKPARDDTAESIIFSSFLEQHSSFFTTQPFHDDHTVYHIDHKQR